jgi:hypothetical protein
MQIERRYKILNLDKEELVGIFNHLNAVNIAKHENKDLSIAVTHFPELPKGYEVHDIIFSFERQCFQLLIWHKTFPVIPPQMMITDFVKSGEPTYHIVKIQKD